MKKALYELFKPGIIYGNAMPFVAAYILAAGFSDLRVFLEALVGQSLVIGGACVFNNVLDRKIDRKMDRTKHRLVASGKLPVGYALIIGTLTSMGGLALLLLVSWLVFCIGLSGLLLYVLVYGYAKRRGPIGTLIGSVPGALPPVAGYVAGAGHFDMTAALLFIVLAAWQMPHFYAIAMYRRKDYAAAHLPVLPVVRSMRRTKRSIFSYLVLFWLAVMALAASPELGLSYLLLAALLGGWWFATSVATLRLPDAVWARKVFLKSLVTLVAICVVIPLGRYLP